MKKFKVKKLNQDGISEFSLLLDDVKLKPDLAIWEKESNFYKRVKNLLEDSNFVEKFVPEVMLEPGKSFKNRFEFGEYLYSQFGNEGIEEDKGLLSWLALFYFDQICRKKNKTTKLVVLSKYRYIPELENPRRFYRHLILTPYLLYRVLKEESEFFLANPLYESSDAVEQLVSRREIIHNRTLIRVARKLYFNEKTRTRRIGAFTKTKKGNALRLARDLVPQLSMNYDLYATDEAKLISLLPKEYDDWLNKTQKVK